MVVGLVLFRVCGEGCFKGRLGMLGLEAGGVVVYVEIVYVYRSFDIFSFY